MYLSSLKKILLQFSNDTCTQENCAFQSSLPTIKMKHLERTSLSSLKDNPSFRDTELKGTVLCAMVYDSTGGSEGSQI